MDRSTEKKSDNSNTDSLKIEENDENRYNIVDETKENHTPETILNENFVPNRLSANMEMNNPKRQWNFKIDNGQNFDDVPMKQYDNEDNKIGDKGFNRESDFTNENNRTDSHEDRSHNSEEIENRKKNPPITAIERYYYNLPKYQRKYFAPQVISNEISAHVLDLFLKNMYVLNNSAFIKKLPESIEKEEDMEAQEDKNQVDVKKRIKRETMEIEETPRRQRGRPPYVPPDDNITDFNEFGLKMDEERGIIIFDDRLFDFEDLDGIRYFLCPLKSCDKKFPSLSRAKRHWLTHTNFRPFKCQNDPCDKTFSRSDNMHQHMESHCFYKDRHKRKNS